MLALSSLKKKNLNLNKRSRKSQNCHGQFWHLFKCLGLWYFKSKLLFLNKKGGLENNGKRGKN